MKIGILSDAHGNYRSFLRCLEHFEKSKVNHIFYLGDAIGYLPNVEVIDELIKLDKKVSCVLGNHEDLFINHFENYKEKKIYCANIIKKNIKNKHIHFINTWPKFISLNINKNKLLFIHGNPADHTYGYLYENSDFSEFNTPYNYIFAGHTHIPFAKQFKNTCYVNVGSCGLPRDKGSEPSGVILDTKKNDLKIFRYDITDIVKLIKKESFNLVDKKVLRIFDR